MCLSSRKLCRPEFHELLGWWRKMGSWLGSQSHREKGEDNETEERELGKKWVRKKPGDGSWLRIPGRCLHSMKPLKPEAQGHWNELVSKQNSGKPP